MVADFTVLGADCPKRNLSKITHILVHRCEDGDNAEQIAKFFRDNPKWTGGAMGYHIVITPSGEIEQAVAFDRRAPGARAANGVGIQVALARLTLTSKATEAQEVALVDVCIDLCEYIGFKRAVICGHTDYPGASADPTKVCPGPGIDLNMIREHTMAWACSMPTDESREHLEEVGYVFERKA